jgi:hypothetical protein
MSMIRNEDDDVGGTEKRNLSIMIEKKMQTYSNKILSR